MLYSLLHSHPNDDNHGDQQNTLASCHGVVPHLVPSSSKKMELTSRHLYLKVISPYSNNVFTEYTMLQRQISSH